jgi:hypothetical protein
MPRQKTERLELLTVKLRPETLADFRIACELKEVSMSAWIRQFVKRTIREERHNSPRAFARHDDDKDMIPMRIERIERLEGQQTAASEPMTKRTTRRKK